MVPDPQPSNIEDVPDIDHHVFHAPIVSRDTRTIRYHDGGPTQPSFAGER